MPRCTIEGCDTKVYARSMCKRHYSRVLRHGDPSVVKPGGGSRGRGPQHPNWKGRSVSYRSAHMRVQHIRGKASAQLCVCGHPAQDWAYDYSDPSPLMGSNGKREMVYSPDVDRYQPMCRPCHRQFDKERDGESSRLRTFA